MLSTCADDTATVRVVFDWSHDLLTAAQAQLFRHLVEPFARERCQFHDLLRTYAAERAGCVLFPDHSTLDREPRQPPKAKLTRKRAKHCDSRTGCASSCSTASTGTIC